MGSFRDEITRLHQSPTTEQVVNDIETQTLYKCRADKYVDAIYEQIKGAIRREAAAGRVSCDQVQKGWLRRRWQEYNHHYRVYWNVVFELEFCESTFGPILGGTESVLNDLRSRFVVNDYEMIEYILRSIATKLRADEIYPAETAQDDFFTEEMAATEIAISFPSQAVQERYEECQRIFATQGVNRQTIELGIPFIMFI